MSLRTPLGRVRGLGSAKHGTHHWIAQRLTAVALIPLMLWLVASLVHLTGAGYEAAVAWIGRPLNTVLLVLLIAAAFHHAQLGLQVVFEDYVSAEWLKVANLLLLKLIAVLLATVAIVSVLRIAFGS